MGPSLFYKYLPVDAFSALISKQPVHAIPSPRWARLLCRIVASEASSPIVQIVAIWIPIWVGVHVCAFLCRAQDSVQQVFVACGFDHGRHLCLATFSREYVDVEALFSEVVANMFSIPLGIMFGADVGCWGWTYCTPYADSLSSSPSQNTYESASTISRVLFALMVHGPQIFPRCLLWQHRRSAARRFTCSLLLPTRARTQSGFQG